MLNLYLVIRAGPFSHHAVDLHSLCEDNYLYGQARPSVWLREGPLVKNSDGDKQGGGNLIIRTPATQGRFRRKKIILFFFRLGCDHSKFASGSRGAVTIRPTTKLLLR